MTRKSTNFWTCSRVVFFLVLYFYKYGLCADLVIRIPVDLSQQDGIYRLDYSPPRGEPPANTTFHPQEISDVIKFSHGLPGTKYDFYLFYSNATIKHWPTWTASITTTPDPPSNLSVNVLSSKVASVLWNPPTSGGYSGFRVKVIPLSEPQTSIRSIEVNETSDQFLLRNLTPGASYTIQLYTLYQNKESAVYISRNFTAKPSTPGRFIVWFRNETTLLVLWQPPYPAGIFTHYKVAIDPADAQDSELYVEKEGEPPGPAQAAFNGLIPGRAYNISVHTVSEDQISSPTTAQYRTVPLRPRNVTYDKRNVRPDSFDVFWEAPQGVSEFDRYQVSIVPRKPAHAPVTIGRDERLVARFSEGLEAGKTYQVAVKTVSGNVASWPAQGNITTRPFPVVNLLATKFGDINIKWDPHPSSIQDSYKVTYHEVENFNGDSSSIIVDTTEFSMSALLPGRNYSLAVTAISNNVESLEETIFQATRPASPIIKELQPLIRGLNISWKSDVTSRQDKYAIHYTRNDTGELYQLQTTESGILIHSLYPGAGYEIAVYAVSHDLQSEPHLYFQAVYPNPVRNLTVTKTSNTSVTLSWLPPLNSLYSGYIIRYCPYDNKTCTELPPVLTTTTEVKGLEPGQQYMLQVNSVSYRVESSEALKVTESLPPSGVSDIHVELDSTNVTLWWDQPEGHLDFSYLQWWRENGTAESYVPDRQTDDEEEEAEIEREHDKQPLDRGRKQIPAEVGNNKKITVLVDMLRPGELYHFQLHTISNGLQSPIHTKMIRTKPLITSEITLVTNVHETAVMTLRYTPTPFDISRFDSYRFELVNSGVQPQEKAATDTDRKVTFSDLVPGRLYNITLWTVSGDVYSRPLLRQERLYPEPVTSINATSITDTEVMLVWDRPLGDYGGFEVQYLTADDRLLQNFTIRHSLTLDNLRPHRNYTFTVVVVSGASYGIQRRSLPLSATFSTKESVPGKVVRFEPNEIKPSEVVFQWDLPSAEQNGIITGFVVTYRLKDSTLGTQTQNFNPTETRGTITNLYPGKEYLFMIQAQTKIGSGSIAKYELKMPIWAPPKPSNSVYPLEVSKTSTTVKIQFHKAYFSDQNGRVMAYAVIVAEDDRKPVDGQLQAWKDVQSYSIWPPYQVSEAFNPFQNSTVEDFVIGTENCENRKGYCNGPLKPGTSYRVKIRAFTSQNKYSDTVYSHPITTDRNNTALILGITLPLILLIVIAVVLMVVRLRQVGLCMTKRKKSAVNELALPDNMTDTRPVKLKDFADHYRLMSADSDFRFSEEFEDLKHVGREQPCTAADLPVNRPKNRFTNILPYDHSRFKLQPTDDEEGSDFVNANYVPGFNSPREFIVTQGPLHSTRDDFWRMCWESNSRAIVMLTRCIEKAREKCDHYWPYDTQPVYYGDIQVQILNESHYPDWNISEFRMSRGDQMRLMRHFHFTTWPDFGVPDPPQTLVRFVRAFRERVSGTEQKPIVVHCSAGVGRSGTFIALDRLLQHIKKSDYVDIFGIVYQMRKERVWMVQTEQQYICIHQCLMAVLEGKDIDVPIHEIHQNEGFEDDEGIAESGM